MDLNRYRQTDREDETYVAPFECLSCKGRWVGGVTHDPAQPGAWPCATRFCPCCGIAFAGELRRSAATERRHELRGEAASKAYDRAQAREITYEIQTWADFRPSWERETDYPTRGRQEAAMAWRQRLRAGSWFGEAVRLVARAPAVEKVVFGPMRLEPDTARLKYDDDDEG